MTAVKPIVGRITLPDGKLRLFGVSAAARWLGCTQGALSAVCRGIPGRGRRLRDRVAVEFPDLLPAAEVQHGA